MRTLSPMKPIVLAMALALAMTTACRRIGQDSAGTATPPVTRPDPAPDATVIPVLDAAGAGELAALSLACVDREYPNKPGSVVDGDETVVPLRRPAEVRDAHDPRIGHLIGL